MPIQSAINAALHLTERGQKWLVQFDASDRPVARSLLEALTLVSHNEFERALDRMIRAKAAEFDGPIGLYATREVPPASTQSYFEFASSPDTPDGLLSAVASGNDLGSEARVAALIRAISRSLPTKFLNHPTVDALRAEKVDAIIVVDDLVGSGTRTNRFLDRLWQNSTIKSWWSREDIKFGVVAYAATSGGMHYVRKHKCEPEVVFERLSPTLDDLPWLRATRENLASLLTKYGKRTSKRSMSLGYKRSSALLVFEHGCPNNVPSVLWAPSTADRPWIPLFPSRTILPAEQSAFPPEIVRRDPVLVLNAAGQTRLAAQWEANRTEPLGQDAITLLALLAKRFRAIEALAFATGLPMLRCLKVIEDCIAWGLVTPAHRLTERGRAELHATGALKIHAEELPDIGSDEYYPKVLRTHVGS